MKGNEEQNSRSRSRLSRPKSRIWVQSERFAKYLCAASMSRPGGTGPKNMDVPTTNWFLQRRQDLQLQTQAAAGGI